VKPAPKTELFGDEVKSSPPRKTAQGVTINQLATETGSDQRSIKKWLNGEGLEPIGHQKLGQHESALFQKEAALEIIARHQAKNSDGNEDNKVDPDTGLTWFQAYLREQTLERRRKNEIAEKVKDEEFMRAEDVKQVFAVLMNGLDQLPGKLKSELGLTTAQKTRVQTIVDEARKSAAKRIMKG
jgi:hypothetical protein